MKTFLAIISVPLFVGIVTYFVVSSIEPSNDQFLKGIEIQLNADILTQNKNNDFSEIEPVTILTNRLIYTTRFKNISPGEVTEEEVREIVYPELLANICSGETAEFFSEIFERNITVAYSYKDNEGNQVVYLPFTNESCGKN